MCWFKNEDLLNDELINLAPIPVALYLWREWMQFNVDWKTSYSYSFKSMFVEN